jgi:hypothetical protein
VGGRTSLILKTTDRGKKHSRKRHDQYSATSFAKTETTFIHARPVRQQRFTTISVVSSDKIPGFPDRFWRALRA